MPRKKIQTGFAGEDNCLPESKVFGGSAETDEEFAARPIMDCHVGGVSVRDMPLLTQRCLHMDQTDEGFAAKNAGKVEKIGVDTPREDFRYVKDTAGGMRVETVMRSTDELGKKLDQYREDMTQRNFDSYHARNPHQELLDKHVPKGMAGKLLSQKSTEIGNAYEVAKLANGDPVKFGNMVLGVTTKKYADSKNAHVRGKGKDRLDQMSREQVRIHGGDTRVTDQQ